MAKKGYGLLKNLTWFRNLASVKKFQEKNWSFCDEKNLYRGAVNLLLVAKEKLAEP